MASGTGWSFPSSEAASVRASFRTSAFRGPIWFARSTNGGLSWEPARQLYDPGQNDQTIGNQIAVLPNGTLVNLFAEFNNENTNQLRAGRCGCCARPTRASAGPVRSWSTGCRRSGSPTLDTGDDVRTGDIIPDVAVDPASGRLYAVWQDARFGGGQFDSIAFSQSLDGGPSWSTPIKVNQTPTNLPAGNQQAFTASVHVTANGTVGVPRLPQQHPSAGHPGDRPLPGPLPPHHPDSLRDRGNWGDEVQVTTSSFNMRRAPDAGGFFTGDYEGLDNIGTAFASFYSQPHGTDPSSAFFRRVG